ncbi:MAG: phospholipase D-like domain-containing protein [Candidatus Bipolaricaulota bacterium]
MKRVAILILGLAWAGAAVPVVPLWTAPDMPMYQGFVEALIASADEEVLAALSDARLYSGNGATAGLLTSLAEAAGRGVRVRVLAETREAGPYPEQRAALAYLEERGVEVRWDTPEVTLHTKFLVVDRRWVVAGSTHWTMSALTRSIQLDLAVESVELGAAFGQFFDYLWEGQLKTTPELPPLPWPRPAVVPLLDFPKGNLHAQVIPDMIRQAKESVQAIIYRLGYYPTYSDSPSNRIVEALCAAAARGVEVRVLIEGGEDFADLAQDNRVSAAYLISCGVAVRFDAPGTTLHAKCLVVDGRDVLVTSANWSYYSLVHNVEAGIAVLGAPELALPLVHLFDEIWTQARPIR